MEFQQLIVAHLLAISLALVLDAIIGDPVNWPHPVRWFGRWISFVDKRLNQGKFQRMNGLFLVLSMVVWCFILPLILLSALYETSYWIGIIVEGVVIATTISTKSLGEAAYKVAHPLQKGDLQEARFQVGMIVGRDTNQLDESEIARATVETVAENTSDGITAPLFFAFLLGGAGAFFYRSINTCDSMVGYKNPMYEKFGYFSAKLDDWLNFIPSRLTAFIMVISNVMHSEFTAKHVFSIIKRDAPKHPSPNSGYGESAVAGLLGIQLGGRNTYKGIVSNRAKMGDPLYSLNVSHIFKTVQVMKRTVWCTWFFYLIGGILIGITYTWS